MEEHSRDDKPGSTAVGTPPPGLPGPPQKRGRAWLIVLFCLAFAIWAAAGVVIATRLASNESEVKGNTTDKDISIDEGTKNRGIHERDAQGVHFDLDFKIHLTGNNLDMEFTAAVPRNIDRRQRVLGITYDPQPEEILDIGENRYARFVITDPWGDFNIRISGDIELSDYDLSTAMRMEKPGEEANLEEYLTAEKYLEKDAREVKAAAGCIEGEDELDTVEQLFDYVLENMYYSEYNPGDVGAVEALINKGGDCTEYSDVLVALCRAKGIPAKTAEGYVIDEVIDGQVLSTQKHNWIEIYLEDYGWIPFDPTFADSGLASFYELDPVYIQVSDVRNDGVLNYGHFWAYHYRGDPIKVTENLDFSPI